MVKKALSQSDFEILKSAISLEQLGHLACFSCMLIKKWERWKSV